MATTTGEKAATMWLIVGKIPKLDLFIKEEAPGTTGKQAISRLKLRLIERYPTLVIPPMKELTKYLRTTDTGKPYPSPKPFPKPLENPWWND